MGPFSKSGATHSRISALLFGTYTIQFAGGEPFIFKPFLSLVEWCNVQGIDWGVTTNGSRIFKSGCQRIVSAKLRTWMCPSMERLLSTTHLVVFGDPSITLRRALARCVQHGINRVARSDSYQAHRSPPQFS